MPIGGKRPGAGRPKGAPNKATAARAAEIAASGLTPLEFMLGVLRNEQKTDDERFEAAKAAAPYVHPRLSSVEAKVEAEVTGQIRRIERTIVDPEAADA